MCTELENAILSVESQNGIIAVQSLCQQRPSGFCIFCLKFNLSVSWNADFISHILIYHQLRTRRALSLYRVYGDSALLVLNGTSLSCNNALMALNWWNDHVHSIGKCNILSWQTDHQIIHIPTLLYNFLLFSVSYFCPLSSYICVLQLLFLSFPPPLSFWCSLFS